jgi:hypothetical protein
VVAHGLYGHRHWQRLKPSVITDEVKKMGGLGSISSFLYSCASYECHLHLQSKHITLDNQFFFFFFRSASQTQLGQFCLEFIMKVMAGRDWFCSWWLWKTC